MFSLISLLTIAQAAPIPTPTPPPPQEITVPQTIRALPGQLDQVPVFNSNSPEKIQTEGILLSTFPPDGKSEPSAHLNFPFEGRFDVFAHHVYGAATPEELPNLLSMYLGIILYNPGSQPVTVDVLQAASYLSQPDAPFEPLPAVVENPLGTVYAGPGSRVMNDILRGQRSESISPQVVVPPGEYQMLVNLPIPVETLEPPLNGRSTLMRLRSDGRIYAASLALQARRAEDGTEQAPTLPEWQALLETGSLAGARDRAPTPPEQTAGQIIYGRVAGVAQGSQWQAQVIDDPASDRLTIPAAGEAFSYGLSTLVGGRLGTEQVQTAPMLVRYPDTAYQAHGNYGIEYLLAMPLHNPTDQPQTVTVSLQTPIKDDQGSQGGLRFFAPLPTQTFFRGTVRLRYVDDRGLPRTRYVHLVQVRGQQGEPLITLEMPAGDRRLVEFSFLYPPDSTPPQVLTVRTLNRLGNE
ncbi:DUF3370 domain-containing protein [Oculatella sp. LEGE 06141]|uniref:DUF3370 domain-containing protein n=1 Tax=Oculatella sp. LEGE 06141 TaxID=1828648 RepID=UPI00187DDE06|nr:DUF3370 domain-containing protein [Oculatella sp. LEGE 06141]MBE9182304.1 DUF3370 domain-containing protein [Oculatella sp. LEGE 06141]